MEDTDKILLGVIAVASVATAINTGIIAGQTNGTHTQGPVGGNKDDQNGDNPTESSN